MDELSSSRSPSSQDATGDMSTAKVLENAFQQTNKYVAQAAARAGVKL
jgi:hypothetical protein